VAAVIRGRVDAKDGNGDLLGSLFEHFLVCSGLAAGGLVACSFWRLDH